VVIGAGVSGGVVAKRLVEAGLSVLCLEQGQWPDRADYPGASPEWELRAAKQWSSSPGVRNGPADYPIDVTASDFGVLNFNGVGGGSILYNAQWPRMLPEDFGVRTVDGVADDWPIGYGDLQSYYEATDLDFGVSGLGGNSCGSGCNEGAKASADITHWRSVVRLGGGVAGRRSGAAPVA
jgi:choline dehydrogenase-like flavoprotein